MIGRRALALAMLALAMPGAVATSSRAQAPARPESRDGTVAMIVVHVGRYASGSVMALRTDSTLLVSLRPVLQLAGIRLRPEGRRLTGALQPSGTPIDVDPDARVIRVGARRVVAHAREFVVRDGHVHLAVPVLARAFGLRLRYDTDEGVLVVENADSLPIALRQVHAAARAAVIEAARQADGDKRAAAKRDRPGFGAVVDYTVSRWGGMVPGVRRDGDPAGSTTGSFGIAVAAPRGVLAARVVNDGVVDPGGELSELSWTMERATGRLLRTLRLGFSQSAGLRPVAIRGIMLSNAPPTRDQATATTTLGGSVPNGWLVEAYRAGSLLAADTAGSGGVATTDPTALVDEALAPAGTRRYALTVPVHAGQTAVDLVAVGPDGQLRMMQRLVQVMPLELPAHTFEYRLVAGQCDPRDLPTGTTLSTCRDRMSVDLRYALSERWAVRGGVDAMRLRVPGSGAHPYLALAATPWNALSLTVEHAPDQLEHVAVRFQPGTGFLLSADHMQSRDAWVPRVALDASALQQSALANMQSTMERTSVAQSSVQLLVAPRALHGVALEAHDVRTVWRGGAWEQQQFGTVVPVGLADMRSYVRREVAAETPGGTFIGTSATILPTGALARLLGRTWITTVGELARDGRPARGELTVARPLGAFWRTDVSTFWDRRSPGMRASIALTSQLPVVRTASQTSVATNGTGGFTTHSVSGSAVWDPSAHTVVLGGESGLDRGGISGRVFLDVNGNGRRDPGEPGIPGAVLQLATRTVTADGDGRYRVLGLPPETAVHIVLDSSSLASPWWAPAAGEIAVRASAGRVARVDVPVVIGGVVNGRVVVDGAAPGTPVPGGTQVIVCDLARARVYHADVFSDGAFSVSGLPPGRFDAHVDFPALVGTWVGDSVVVAIELPRVAAQASALDAVGPIVDDVRLALHRVRSAAPVARDTAPADATPDSAREPTSVHAPVIQLEGFAGSAPVLVSTAAHDSATPRLACRPRSLVHAHGPSHGAAQGGTHVRARSVGHAARRHRHAHHPRRHRRRRRGGRHRPRVYVAPGHHVIRVIPVTPSTSALARRPECAR